MFSINLNAFFRKSIFLIIFKLCINLRAHEKILENEQKK